MTWIGAPWGSTQRPLALSMLAWGTLIAPSSTCVQAPKVAPLSLERQ